MPESSGAILRAFLEIQVVRLTRWVPRAPRVFLFAVASAPDSSAVRVDADGAFSPRAHFPSFRPNFSAEPIAPGTFPISTEP